MIRQGSLAVLADYGSPRLSARFPWPRQSGSGSCQMNCRTYEPYTASRRPYYKMSHIEFAEYR
jgi:hypothetical protein